MKCVYFSYLIPIKSYFLPSKFEIELWERFSFSIFYNFMKKFSNFYEFLKPENP